VPRLLVCGPLRWCKVRSTSRKSAHDAADNDLSPLSLMTVDDRWIPDTEEELRAAANAGALTESHYLDIKRDLSTSESARKNFAKDIAAFALDGGVIIIGVDEDSTPPALTPVALRGLAERIDQIAGSRVDEPVRVTTKVIHTENSTDTGYLIIIIPPSPRAPHMADGRYYGRSDTTNRILQDPEVRRLHDSAAAARIDLVAEAEQIRAELHGDAGHSMLVLVAQPVGADPDMLVSLVASREWREMLDEVMTSARTELQNKIEPAFRTSSYLFDRRAGGVAVTTGMIDGSRFDNPSREAAEIVFEESGRVILVSERAVMIYDDNTAPGQSKRNKVVFEDLVIAHTELLVRLAACVGEKWGRSRSWRLALALDGTHGAKSYAIARHRYPERGTAYTHGKYARTADATHRDLLDEPRAMASRLVGSLLRSVGSHEHYAQYLGGGSTERQR
jgi:hypothetical protein